MAWTDQDGHKICYVLSLTVIECMLDNVHVNLLLAGVPSPLPYGYTEGNLEPLCFHRQ